MPMPRLLIPSLLLTAAACASPAPRETAPVEQPAPSAQPAEPAQSGQALVGAMTERCRATVDRHQDASVVGQPTAALMRDDWVQVDGVVEWNHGEAGVARNAWTCDMFRGEDGVWRRRYLSFGPA